MQPRTQQDEFDEIVQLHGAIDIAKARLVESMAKLEGKHPTKENKATLERKHKAITETLAAAYETLSESLKACSVSTQKAYETVSHSGIFETENLRSNRMEALQAEAIKQKQAASPLQPPKKPQKAHSAPGPVNKMSNEERAYREEYLAIKAFLQNTYYCFYNFDGVNKVIESIYDVLSNPQKPYNALYQDTADIRSAICYELNNVIGGHKPSTSMFDKGRDTNKDAANTKIAMCIQQLGGTVTNAAYAERANKEFQKKLPQEAFLHGGKYRPETAPARRSSFNQ